MRAALAGNNLAGPVRPLMQQLAAGLGISRFEFAHIEAVLRIRSGAFRPDASAGGTAAARAARARGSLSRARDHTGRE